MKKNVQILAYVYIFALSTVSFAGSATFYLLNSGDSVKNPITITKSAIEYNSILDNSAECSGRIEGIADGVKVRTRQEATITVELPNLPSVCYSNLLGVYLYIYTVDGKEISSKCSPSYTAFSQSDNLIGDAVKITETNDHFFCEYLSGMK